MFKKRWTEEEIKILEKYFPLGGHKLCVEKGITRGYSTTKTRAYNLGVSHTNRYWSIEEDEVVLFYNPKRGNCRC